MNLCAVTIFVIFAAFIADLMLADPAVKFSMAGRRPEASTAQKAITAPAPVGSMIPTVSSFLNFLPSADPSAKDAAQNGLIVDFGAVAIDDRDGSLPPNSFAPI